MSLHAHVTMQRGPLAIDATFDADDRETLALVGPNGAGKTSVARAVAGLDRIAAGRISLGDDVLDDPAAGVFVRPAQRRIGMVFQDRLLFPHLSIEANVAFGVQARRHGDAGRDAHRIARDWLDRVGLGDDADRRPGELSGGQTALVALARALAPSPRLVLLDEPFAALDAETKTSIRRIVREHLAELDGPSVLITHDPLDALSLASRIAVMENGRIGQTGTPQQILDRPSSRFVAELVGVNRFEGIADGDAIVVGDARIAAVHSLGAGVAAVAVVHPRAVALHASPPGGSPRNVFPSTVVDVIPYGDVLRVTLAGPLPIVAAITPAGAASIALQPGATVYAVVKATEVDVHRS